jgi:hypothetical protein
MSTASALAIWERYIRASFVHAAGYPTYVSLASHLVDEPARHARDLGRFLEQHGAVAGEKADESEIVSFIRPDLRHHTAGSKLEDSSGGAVTESQLRLWEVAQKVAGGHDKLPALNIGPESPTTELLMTERMFFEEMQDEFRAREKEMRSRLKRSAKRSAKKEAKSRSDAERERHNAEAAKVEPDSAAETVPSDVTPASDAIGQSK